MPGNTLGTYARAAECRPALRVLKDPLAFCANCDYLRGRVSTRFEGTESRREEGHNDVAYRGGKVSTRSEGTESIKDQDLTHRAGKAAECRPALRVLKAHIVDGRIGEVVGGRVSTRFEGTERCIRSSDVKSRVLKAEIPRTSVSSFTTFENLLQIVGGTNVAVNAPTLFPTLRPSLKDPLTAY